jgi:hypothetical protein
MAFLLARVTGQNSSVEQSSNDAGEKYDRTLCAMNRQALARGCFLRRVQIRGNGQTSEKLQRKSLKQIANTRESLSRRIERAEPVEAD